jgi:N-acetyltransferase 10
MDSNSGIRRYEVPGDDENWDEAEKQVLKASKEGHGNLVVSVKSKKEKKRKVESGERDEAKAGGEKKRKKPKSSRMI